MAFTLDPELLQNAREDADALDAFIGQIWPEVYRVCLGIVRDRTSAEDAAQDACAAMARSLGSLRDDAAFYGWMYRIAGRCAVACAKAMSRETSLHAAPAYASDRDAVIDLRDALRRLPLAQRSAVVLHYYAGLSSVEIGEALHVPPVTVRFHLMLARRSLRALLRTVGTGAKEGCANVR